MNISMQKLTTLIIFKAKELSKNKTFIISLILVPALTLGMRVLYEGMFEGELEPELLAMVLNLGVLYNLNAISLMMPATMLAKDKEKNTLRVLMTSSVNGTEYFISSVMPSLIISIFINVLVLVISGIPITVINVALYLLVTTIASLTSCIIGMTAGLFSKNQMSSSNLVTVIMMVLMMIPLFGGFSEQVASVSKYLYTGIVSDMITVLASGKTFSMDILSWGILIGFVIIAAIVFISSYRKNGFDRD